MDMAIKCEIAHNILDYIWCGLYGRRDSYDQENDGIVSYTDEAQDIFNNVLDLIEEGLGE